jgi:hypothetical protein
MKSASDDGGTGGLPDWQFRSGFKILDHTRGQGAGRFERAATTAGCERFERPATLPSGVRRGFETAFI